MASATLKPTSNTSPSDQIAGESESAVNSPTNDGHASTTSTISGVGAQNKSCEWSGFPAPGVTPTLVNLKVDYSINGSFASLGSNFFELNYSTDGGSSYTEFFSATDVSSSSSGTAEVTLSNGQDLTQVRVADLIRASGIGGGSSASLTATITNPRIEITWNLPTQVFASNMM